LIDQFDYLLNAEAPATSMEQNKAAAFMVLTTIRIRVAVDGVGNGRSKEPTAGGDAPHGSW